jgi:deoxyribodipyrimidine photolyase-related protein
VRPTARVLLILGDQLSPDHPALAALDAAHDQVLMIETAGEATAVWSHQARIALFLSAMRHHRDALRARGWTVDYLDLDSEPPDAPAGLDHRLARALQRLRPSELWLMEPGEWRIERLIEATAAQAGVPLRWWVDPHFLCTRERFARWAQGRKQLRMEHFYREMRREHQVLLDAQGQPEGGAWNFDADNRQPYPKGGPGAIPPPAWFPPDAITQEVLALVARRFAGHPGSLAHFAWPVTPDQAQAALQRFIEHRLVGFGPYQDAMWTDTPWGWHSLLSSSLNLHLLDPRTVIAAAETAYREEQAPLAGVEGFIRQIMGWREFIRGVYWLDMPGLRQANHYGHHRPLPAWYWTGDTRMACLRDALKQTLTHGYAHHIQRLMVTGLFGTLAQVEPAQVSDWYRAVYVDAVEWVESPNTLGMALHANGGRFTSKPYVASGAYIERQSNLCKTCEYRPKEKTGPRACPFTTLYWYFLDNHRLALRANPRTRPMTLHLDRWGEDEREALRQAAEARLQDLDSL